MLVKHVTYEYLNMLAMRDEFIYNKDMITIMAKQRGSMDARISVTITARDTLSGVMKGMGIKYDDFVRHYLEQLGLDPAAGEEAGIRAGLQHRGEIRSYDSEREQEIIEAGKQEDDE
jgi:hypothetical protein